MSPSDETRGWIRQVASRTPEFDDVARAKLRSIDTLLRAQTGDYDQAREALEWSLGVFRRDAMPFQAAVTLMTLSAVHFGIDRDVARATTTLEESIRLFASVGHDWGVARTEIMLATMLASIGDIEASERHLHRSLEHARLIENEPQIARALSLLAMLAHGRKPSDAAAPLLREAGAIVVKGRYRTEAAYCLGAIAAGFLAQGEVARAAEAAAVSESVRRALGLAPAPILAQIVADASRVAATAPDIRPAQPDSVFDYVSRALELTPA